MITFDPDGTVARRPARGAIARCSTRCGPSTARSASSAAPTARRLAAELQQHFAYPLAEAEGQRFGARIDDRVVSMDRIAARVLEEVRSDGRGAPRRRRSRRPSSRCPRISPRCSATPSAAPRARRSSSSIASSTSRPPPRSPTATTRGSRRRAIAVWDFGGGTFDFSIVDVDRRPLEVVATGGDYFVGGPDFDDLVASYVLGEFQREQALDVDPDPQQIARLREAAEIAKRALSVQTECFVELPEFTRDPKRNVHVEVTRERLRDDDAAARRPHARDRRRGHSTSIGLGPKDVDDVAARRRHDAHPRRAARGRRLLRPSPEQAHQPRRGGRARRGPARRRDRLRRRADAARHPADERRLRRRRGCASRRSSRATCACPRTARSRCRGLPRHGVAPPLPGRVARRQPGRVPLHGDGGGRLAARQGQASRCASRSTRSA